MEGVVSIEERRNRNEQLRILSEKKKRFFYEQFSNTQREVLFESEAKEGVMSGFTDNYIKIETPLEAYLLNTIGPVAMSEVDAEGVMIAQVLETIKN
jgi:threonylcarbamoyladenosine tRNA methylthiotransferase MtaB